MKLKDINKCVELCVDFDNSKVDLRLSSILRDIRCGWKSNIPICCIFFFCFVLRFLYFFINFALVKRFIYWYPPTTICNYKPCFICLLFRRVRKLYVCSESDVTCCCFGKQPIMVVLQEERLSK